MSVTVPHGFRLFYLRTRALGRAPLMVLLSLMGVTAAAWALTVYQALNMGAPIGAAVRAGIAADGIGGMAMSGMAAAGWSLTGLAVSVTIWTIMMIAMMLPSAAPMILIFASAQARRKRGVAVPTWIFVGGYILVWAAVGLLVYVLAQAGADVLRGNTSLDRSTWAPLALAITLVLAGLYQFTPLKRICLRHCRSPFGFVAQYWRDGWAGALGMGARHGLYCLGCCWALFAVLVAAGMMSIAWMLLLTLLIFAEKVFPYGARMSAAVGLAFIALGLLIASGRLQLP